MNPPVSASSCSKINFFLENLAEESLNLALHRHYPVGLPLPASKGSSVIFYIQPDIGHLNCYICIHPTIRLNNL